MNAIHLPSNLRVDDFVLQGNVVGAGLLEDLLRTFAHNDGIRGDERGMTNQSASDIQYESFAVGAPGLSLLDVSTPYAGAQYESFGFDASDPSGVRRSHWYLSSAVTPSNQVWTSIPLSYTLSTAAYPSQVFGTFISNTNIGFGMLDSPDAYKGFYFGLRLAPTDPAFGMLGLLTFADFIDDWIASCNSRPRSADVGAGSDVAGPTFASIDDYRAYDTVGWDGYDAQPITSETLGAAKDLIKLLPATAPTPSVAPGADGTIGLEWRFTTGPLRKLFIDVGPSEKIVIYSEPIRGYPETRTWNSLDELNPTSAVLSKSVAESRRNAGGTTGSAKLWC
jgi:hypothetical protein